jgi:hypothetical protein
LTQAEYDEIASLIGRHTSLFEAQLDAMGKYGGDLKSLFTQMDKAIQAAQIVLQQDREATGLSGSGMFVSSSRHAKLGAINNLAGTEKGDGFRTSDWRHQARAPIAKVVGKGVPMQKFSSQTQPMLYHSYTEGPVSTPWTGQLQNQMGPIPRETLPVQFNSSFLPSQPDPAAKHRVSNTGAPQFTMPKAPNKLFGSQAATQMSRNKMAGLEGNNLGLTLPVGEGIKLSTFESIALLGASAWLVKSLGSAYINAGTLRKGMMLDAGVDKAQTKQIKQTGKLGWKKRAKPRGKTSGTPSDVTPI